MRMETAHKCHNQKSQTNGKEFQRRRRSARVEFRRDHLNARNEQEGTRSEAVEDDGNEGGVGEAAAGSSVAAAEEEIGSNAKHQAKRRQDSVKGHEPKSFSFGKLGTNHCDAQSEGFNPLVREQTNQKSVQLAHPALSRHAQAFKQTVQRQGKDENKGLETALGAADSFHVTATHDIGFVAVIVFLVAGQVKGFDAFHVLRMSVSVVVMAVMAVAVTIMMGLGLVAVAVSVAFIFAMSMAQEHTINRKEQQKRHTGSKAAPLIQVAAVATAVSTCSSFGYNHVRDHVHQQRSQHDTPSHAVQETQKVLGFAPLSAHEPGCVAAEQR